MDQNKKILIDGRFINPENAGLGRYSGNLLKSLFSKKTGFDYIVMVRKGDVFDADLKKIMDSSPDNIEIFQTDIKHYSLEEQLKLSKKIQALKPDLVHFLHFNHPANYKGNFVVTIHDLTLSVYSGKQSFIERLAYEYVMKHAAKKSKAILTVSNYVAKDIAKTYGISRSKIYTTYNGVDESFRPISNPRTLIEAEKKYKLKSPFILSVGQWRTHKNLSRLVQAFATLIKAKEFTDYRLVFVGKKDARDDKFIKLVDELGLADRVEYTGFIEDKDLPTVYNLAEVFVFPSLSEGFGLPGIEAQACQTAVVSSDATSLPEVLGEGAVYFNPQNVRDMANSIRKVLLDHDLARKIKDAGITNVAKYTWDNCANSTLEVYRRILYKDIS